MVTTQHDGKVYLQDILRGLTLCEVTILSIATVLSVKSLRDMHSFLPKPRIYVITIPTSQTSEYLGKGGLRWKTPLINLETSGWLVKSPPPSMLTRGFRALLAAQAELYPSPSSNLSAIKLRTLPIDVKRGFSPRLRQNSSHFLRTPSYLDLVFFRHDAKTSSLAFFESL